MENTENRYRFFQRDLFKATLKLLIVVAVAASIFVGLFTAVIPVVKYHGESMAPTLENGDLLVVSELSDIECGDIIAFYYNNKVLVRRVVAEGNQQVSIDIFGTVTVNGEEIEESYVKNKTLGQCNLDFPYSVPAESYFVLGDDRGISMDSRLEEIGTVSKDRILGKVLFH